MRQRRRQLPLRCVRNCVTHMLASALPSACVLTCRLTFYFWCHRGRRAGLPVCAPQLAGCRCDDGAGQQCGADAGGSGADTWQHRRRERAGPCVRAYMRTSCKRCCAVRCCAMLCDAVRCGARIVWHGGGLITASHGARASPVTLQHFHPPSRGQDCFPIRPFTHPFAPLFFRLAYVRLTPRG